MLGLGGCPMATALKFTVGNRLTGSAAAHSHQILRRQLFCGSGLRRSFMVSSRIPGHGRGSSHRGCGESAETQLVQVAGFNSLNAAGKWDTKCRSSFPLCARERRGPLTVVLFIRRASPRSSSCGPNGLQTGHAPLAMKKRRLSLFKFRDLLHE